MKASLRPFRLLLWALALPLGAAAQEAPAPTAQRIAYHLNLTSPSLGIEVPLGERFSLMGEAGVQPAVVRLADFGSAYFNPRARLDLRYYYNFDKRAAAGKRTDDFSGNYVAFVNAGMFTARVLPGRPRSWDTFHGFAWGMQRRFGRFGWLDLQAGAGAWYEDTERATTDNLQFSGHEVRWYFGPIVRLGIGLGR